MAIILDKKCCKKRYVKSCDECCRFNECQTGKHIFEGLTYNDYKLTCSIIRQAIIDYRRKVRSGDNPINEEIFLKEKAGFYTLYYLDPDYIFRSINK